jgi:CRISPR system Cascade subunit CasE
MYLSQLILNERQTQIHRDLGNAHKFHQRIMQAFPDEESRETPREDWHILFRQEPDSDVVLVQSEIEPDWSKLPDHYLRNQAVKEVNLTVDQLSAHRIFQFRLRANPSKRDSKTKKPLVSITGLTS